MRAARALLVVLLLTVGAGSSQAQEGQPPPSQQAFGLEEASELLQSRRAEDVRTAIESLGLLGTPKIIEPLAERIRCGLPRSLLLMAIDTLAVVGDPAAGDVLETLARHRSEAVRAATMNALAATRPPNAQALLTKALSDRDAQARGAAARALGEIEAHSALPRLLAAMDHGVVGAAESVGTLIPPSQVDRLTSRLGKQPFASLSPGLVALVERDDISREAKMELVGDLREMGTPQAARFLRAMADSIGDRTDPLRQAAVRAASQIAE